MIQNSKHIRLKQTTGQSTRDGMSQKAITDALRDQEFKAVLTVEYWQNIEPLEAVNDDLWYDESNSLLFVFEDGFWFEIELRIDTIYIRISDGSTYYWNQFAMLPIGAVLTKVAIEALLVGEISTHTHHNEVPRTIAIPAYNIDLSIGEDFTKVCGANSQFTISNPIIKKPFRLIISGGSLTSPLFAGYTVNWVLTSLITDYIPANTNYLWCEIRSAGQIYIFWGA